MILPPRITGLLMAAMLGVVPVLAAEPKKPREYVPPPPPSLEVELARLATLPACREDFGLAPSRTSLSMLTKVCPGRFPKPLLQREIIGGCSALIDLSDEGRARVGDVQCSVAYLPGTNTEQWDTLARGLFAASTRRAVEATRYRPYEPQCPMVPRTGLVQGMVFVFEPAEMARVPLPKLAGATPIEGLVKVDEIRECLARVDAAAATAAAAAAATQLAAQAAAEAGLSPTVPLTLPDATPPRVADPVSQASRPQPSSPNPQ